MDIESQEEGGYISLASGNCAKPDRVNEMTSDDFRRRLVRIGMSLNGFADVTGANPRTVIRWSTGEQDIPKWVDLVLNLLPVACPPKDGESPARYRDRLAVVLATGGRFHV